MLAAKSWLFGFILLTLVFTVTQFCSDMLGNLWGKSFETDIVKLKEGIQEFRW
jgi:hypothetical protein